MSFKIKTIERVSKFSQAKNKNYTQLVITTEDGRRASGFGNKSNETWAVGYTVPDTEAVIVQNGKYFNIKMVAKPKQESATGAEKEILKSLDELHSKVDMLDSKLAQLVNRLQGIEESDIDF